MESWVVQIPRATSSNSQRYHRSPRPMTSLILTLDPGVRLTREQFYKLCKVNHDIRLERSSTGDLILMPPTG